MRLQRNQGKFVGVSRLFHFMEEIEKSDKTLEEVWEDLKRKKHPHPLEEDQEDSDSDISIELTRSSDKAKMGDQQHCFPQK